MKQETRIPPFVLRVSEVFSFSGGITVLVGELESGAPQVLAPCDVELIVGHQSRGQIRLESERMPGFTFEEHTMSNPFTKQLMTVKGSAHASGVPYKRSER